MPEKTIDTIEIIKSIDPRSKQAEKKQI